MNVAISAPPFTSTRMVLVRWLVADGAEVREGDPICAFEFLSPYAGRLVASTFDHEAPATGTLRHRVPPGSPVAMGQDVGFVESMAESGPDEDPRPTLP